MFDGDDEKIRVIKPGQPQGEDLMAKEYLRRYCPQWKLDINSGVLSLTVDNPHRRKGIEDNRARLRLYPNSVTRGMESMLYFDKNQEVEQEMLRQVGIEFDEGCWPSPSEARLGGSPAVRGR